MHVIFWMLLTRLQQEKTLYLQRWFPVASDSSSYRVLFLYNSRLQKYIIFCDHDYATLPYYWKLSINYRITKTFQLEQNRSYQCSPRPSEKSSRDWNTSTPIQGQKRIRDSHWGMFDFSDSLHHLFPDKLHIPVTASGCADMALTAIQGRWHT